MYEHARHQVSLPHDPSIKTNNNKTQVRRAEFIGGDQPRFSLAPWHHSSNIRDFVSSLD